MISTQRAVSPPSSDDIYPESSEPTFETSDGIYPESSEPTFETSDDIYPESSEPTFETSDDIYPESSEPTFETSDDAMVLPGVLHQQNMKEDVQVRPEVKGLYGANLNRQRTIGSIYGSPMVRRWSCAVFDARYMYRIVRIISPPPSSARSSCIGIGCFNSPNMHPC